MLKGLSVPRAWETDSTVGSISPDSLLDGGGSFQVSGELEQNWATYQTQKGGHFHCKKLSGLKSQYLATFPATQSVL